jgi:hypothetical protein
MKNHRLLFSFLLTAASIYLAFPSTAQTQSNLPTRLSSNTAGQQILLPDWQRISFSQMPPIPKSCSIKINGFSRQWNTGDTPDKYLTLGDIDEALKPQLFSLNNIANTTNNHQIGAYTLSSFPLLGKQSIQYLTKIVPNLGETSTVKIPAIASLIKSKFLQINLNAPLSNLISQNPSLGKLKLKQIDLSSYTIADIPNIDAVQISKFAGWQNTLIKDVPGLNYVPLASFPLPLTETGSKVARIDFIWGGSEKRRQRTVSGSDVAGFSVPCSGQKYPYIELDDLENVGRTRRDEFEGSSWISGK